MCLWVCFHDNSKLHALILTKLGLYVKVVTISSWLNFGRPAPPGRGSAAGQTSLALPYYSQCAVFASLRAFFLVIFLSFYFGSCWTAIFRVHINIGHHMTSHFCVYVRVRVCVRVCVCVCVCGSLSSTIKLAIRSWYGLHCECWRTMKTRFWRSTRSWTRRLSEWLKTTVWSRSFHSMSRSVASLWALFKSYFSFF